MGCLDLRSGQSRWLQGTIRHLMQLSFSQLANTGNLITNQQHLTPPLHYLDLVVKYVNCVCACARERKR